MRVYYTKKAVILIFVIILCPVFLLSSVFAYTTAHVNDQIIGSSSNRYDKTVIIDPGHGEPDGGAVGVDGVIEMNINLSISLKLRGFFQAAGYTVIMTRENNNAIYDEGSNTIRKKKKTDLHNRLAIVNLHPRALFISIHQNIAKSSNSSGSLVLYSPNNADSKSLAQSIQTGIQNMLQPYDTHVIRQAKKNLYILYNTKSPAVLVECGFLSNPAECKLLQDDTYQNKMAFAIFCGTLQFYATIPK
jgi:N-acetylmuramoyl-L-alanine amidase